MKRDTFSHILQKSRRLSLYAPIFACIACACIISVFFVHVHIASVIGTTTAATVAACATYARSHYRTQKYVRFAIRARLAKKAEPDYDKLVRQFRSVKKYMTQSAHPSPEMRDALHEAEKRIGLRQGSTLALVVPLELILGVPHNCPSAAAMLYSGRHPVVLVDDELQRLLDDDTNFRRSYAIVVSVLCHELAHLLSWNTRWSRLVSIGEIFVSTAAMAALVAYALEHNFVLGAIGAVLAATHLASEPVLADDEHASRVTVVIARLALLAWVPFVLAGVVVGALPLGLTIAVTIISFGLRALLASIRRKQELHADSLSALSMGSSDPLTHFFRSLTTHHETMWSQIYSTHPNTVQRIKNLRSLRI